jgi:hypothetical protein
VKDGSLVVGFLLVTDIDSSAVLYVTISFISRLVSPLARSFIQMRLG